MQKCANEQELIARVKSGDIAAFRTLFEAYHVPVYGFVLRFLGSAHDAEDVTQEVFVKAYRRIKSLRDARYFSSWLFRIAKNQALNFMERQRTKQVDSLETERERVERSSLKEDPNSSPQDRVEMAELEDLLQAALNELPETLRSAFVLGVIEGHSYKEVAEILKCSVGNVKARVFRARSLLTSKLKPELDRV